jgi:hypothetical protein
MHVWLDLDNTIISSVTEPLDETQCHRCNELEMHVMGDGEYYIYERPGLQDFLDYLFSKHTVSVWTAASKNYAAFIIEKFILKKPKRKLRYVCFSQHCTVSKSRYKGNNKFLAMLWHDHGLDDVDPEHCVLIDDMPDWAYHQPEKVITVKPFEIADTDAPNDSEFEEVKKQLEVKSRKGS